MELAVELTSSVARALRLAPSACGYLLREGDTAIWLDCGNGTFPNLQQHIDPAELSAVVITMSTRTTASTSTGSTCPALRDEGRPPGLCPRGRSALGVTRRQCDTFDWNAVGDGDKVRAGSVDLRFSARTTRHRYAVGAAPAGG